MRPVEEERAINHLLMSHGLGKLSDPGLIPQLGYVIRVVVTSHEQFKDALKSIEPETRRDFYESMRTYLSFEAKPLDVYMAELAIDAAARRLPVLQADGTFKEFAIPEIHTTPKDDEPEPEIAALRASLEQRLAQSLIEDAAADKHLAVTCARCTRQDVYHGWNKQAALDKARTEGWRHDLVADKEICPRCAGV